MCDIWKHNNHLKQLTEKDVEGLLYSLKKFKTVEVVMSGGEAILHPAFFSLCGILKKQNIKITLLTSGHGIKRHAENLVKYVDSIIISLDGNEEIHNKIRNIENAFAKTKESIQAIKMLQSNFKITGRTVIHQLNFRIWPQIIDAAKDLQLNSISFLPADVTSDAFDHTEQWKEDNRDKLLIGKECLEELKSVIDGMLENHAIDFTKRYVLESPPRIWSIYQYYAAFAGLADFPYKRCNAPWVSAVIEADGSVKPCFFHNAFGNIKEDSLDNLVNNEAALHFRKTINMAENEICRKCVCSLYLPPTVNPTRN
jgi:MoaA/NifB/PqqE/SkfB family radical SAM enzyme